MDEALYGELDREILIRKTEPVKNQAPYSVIQFNPEETIYYETDSGRN